MPDISDDFEKKHRRNLKNYNRRVEEIYNEAIEKASRSAASFSLPSGTFSLNRIPSLNNRVNEVLAEMRVNIQTTIVNGISTEWDLSSAKNDLFVDKRMSSWLKETPLGAKFYDPNRDAMDAFTKRKVKGLKLSERVWNSVKGYKGELEAGLGLGISAGKSATSMATDLKKYLNHPDSLFRRVQALDKDGNKILKLSRAAMDFHPGRGVYRSSYKNALRLTGTETNMSYRIADHERWQSLPFVVGQEVRLSNQHPQYDICDSCAGRYPKEFIFMGWHPQCICYKVPIMMNDQEYDRYEDALLEGRAPRAISTERVRDVPKGFRDYVSENLARIQGWSNPPYWVRDNFKEGDVANNLKFKTTTEAVPVTGAYSMTPEAIDQLKAMNINLENEKLIAASFNSKMKGFNMQELFTDLDNIGKQHGITWTNKKIQGTGRDEGVFLITRHVGTSTKGEAYIERHFKTENGKTEVYHAFFRIPTGLQGGGMSKQVLGSYYEQYKKAGISKVKVTANLEVGGYTWANYGFSATSKYEVTAAVNSKSFMLSAAQDKTIRDMIENHFNNSALPFPMKAIADLGKLDGTGYGKKLLLGSYWSGELNLADKGMKKVFEDYLNGKSKKK
jgi:hypothetical protein